MPPTLDDLAARNGITEELEARCLAAVYETLRNRGHEELMLRPIIRAVLKEAFKEPPMPTLDDLAATPKEKSDASGALADALEALGFSVDLDASDGEWMIYALLDGDDGDYVTATMAGWGGDEQAGISIGNHAFVIADLRPEIIAALPLIATWQRSIQQGASDAAES